MLGELMVIMGMLYRGLIRNSVDRPAEGSTRGRLLPAPLWHVGAHDVRQLEDER